MTSLVYLNMESARIVEGGDPYYIDGNRKYYTTENIIGDYMFCDALCFQAGNCEVILPSNIIEIGHSAFLLCQGLTSVILPSTLLKISQFAFAYTNIVSVYLPDKLKSIERDAFCSCLEMKAITIPGSMTELGGNAFGYCTKLREIRIKALPTTLTNINSSLFHNEVYVNAILYIPKGTYEDYVKTDFGGFKNIIEE